MEAKKLEFNGDELFTLFYLFRFIINKVDDIQGLQSRNDFNVSLSRRDILNLINVTRKLAEVCIEL